MMKTQLHSTMIGKCLEKHFNNVSTSFEIAAQQRFCTPGEVLGVKLTSFLVSCKVFFVECLPWDAAEGQSEKVSYILSQANGTLDTLTHCFVYLEG